MPYSKQYIVTTPEKNKQLQQKDTKGRKLKKGSDLPKNTKLISSKTRISVQIDSILIPLTLPFCCYYFTDFYSSCLQGLMTSKVTPSSKKQPWVAPHSSSVRMMHMSTKNLRKRNTILQSLKIAMLEFFPQQYT